MRRMSHDRGGGSQVVSGHGLLDTAPCGFISFADDGRVELVNTTLLNMLGYDRADVVGRHIEQLMTVGTRIFYQTHWFPLLRMHGHAEEIFLMLARRDGEQVGMLANAARREHDGRSVYDCVLMRVRERQKFEGELLAARRTAEQASAALQQQKRELQDANELLEAQALELEAQQLLLQEQADESERLRAAAEEANHAKSAFLAVMSHELRTPLNAIAGYVQILQLGIRGPVNDAQREILERLNRSQRHLLGLINDVLNLARIEAGHVEYTTEAIPARVIVTGVLPMIEPQLQEKTLTLETGVPTDVHVLADLEKTQQLLLNLLGNAVKFTPAGGRVRVEADAIDDERVEIRVVDTGIGIPAPKLESIFEPFVQVDSSRTRAAQGSGLGLAISRDLARGMGGELTASSEVGRGSMFTLTLPRARTDPA
jgi:PAS domain S-box-containing protein